MRRTKVVFAGHRGDRAPGPPARQAGVMTYLALGDSVAFGETDFTQNPSNGDRGYVADYANYLASRTAGPARPSSTSAIDGETTSSFLTGTGRVISIPGMTDQQLAAWNTNYTNPATSQNTMMHQAIASAKSAGQHVGVVTISLGANDLFKLAADPTFLSAPPADPAGDARLDPDPDRQHLRGAPGRDPCPGAQRQGLRHGRVQPVPRQPEQPAQRHRRAGDPGAQRHHPSCVAGKWGATYVDTYTPFVGHEAAVHLHVAHLGQRPPQRPGLLGDRRPDHRRRSPSPPPSP